MGGIEPFLLRLFDHKIRKPSKSNATTAEAADILNQFDNSEVSSLMYHLNNTMYLNVHSLSFSFMYQGARKRRTVGN